MFFELIFPFLWFATLLFGFIGSLGNTFDQNQLPFWLFQLLLLVTIIAGVLSTRNYFKNNFFHRFSWMYKLISAINILLTPFILIFFLGGSVTDLSIKRNFVFSQIHLQPKNIYWIVFNSFFLFFLNSRNLINKCLGKGINGPLSKNLGGLNFTKAITVSLFVWVLVYNTRFACSDLFKNIFFIARHPFATYDEKMGAVWGDVYQYALFVKQNTPSNALIANPPPVPPWNNEGSEPLMNALIYPRKTVQSLDDVNYVDSKANYVLLTWGWWKCAESDVGPDDKECHGWPRIDLPADWIIYQKNGSFEIDKKITDTVYNFGSEINQNRWGLIKINKD